MSIELDNPWWLLILSLAIPVLIMATRMRSLHTTRVILVGLLRCLLLACISLALAGATRVRTSDRLAVIALVDLSDSVQNFVEIPGHDSNARAIQSWLDIAVADRMPDDPLAIVAFASHAEALASARSDTPSPSSIPLAIDNPHATNPSRAIDTAMSMMPPDTTTRLVLISDGAVTSGDLETQLQRAQAGAISIDVVPLTFSINDEVLIESFETPSNATRNTSIQARVGLSSTNPMLGTIYIRSEGELVDANPDTPGLGLRVSLEPGLQVFTVPIELDDRPLHRFEAIFEPDDTTLDTLEENNTSSALTVTPGTGAVLVIDGVRDQNAQQPGGLLSATLREEGLLVRTEFPTTMPNDILSLQAYDLIVLENVAADELPESTHTLLREYASTLGGGLLMIGGHKGLGAGRWQDTELAEIIPVQLEVPDQLLAPPAALVLVLDSSGSMRQPVLGGSRTQQQIANDSAALAARTLDTRDELGVIAFSDSHRVVIPLARNENPEEAAEKIRAISPGGGTNIYDAMRSALEMLQNSDASVKHMIVLTDGKDDQDPGIGVRIAQRASQDNISVTTIAVGDEADSRSLARIAQSGNGTFYRIIDPYTLPQVFLKEFRVLRNPLVREETRVPRLRQTGSPIERALSTPLPPIDGMVLSRPRTEPDIFVPMATDDNEPVLAHWNVGLGRVGVLTTDAHEWIQPWVIANRYAGFVVQLARSLARPPSQQQATMTTHVSDSTLQARLTLVEPVSERPLDNAIVEATIFHPDGQTSQSAMRQTAQGTYELSMPATQIGQWIVMVRPRVGDSSLAPVVSGTQSISSPEHRALQPDEQLMRRIATRTGGRIHDINTPELARLFDRRGVLPRQARLPMWPSLLIASLVLALLDMANRRIAWDRLLLPHQRTQEAQPALQGSVLAPIRALRERRRNRPIETSEPRSRASSKSPPRSAKGPTDPPDEHSVSESANSSLLRAKQRARGQYSENNDPDTDTETEL
ncbi:MAG: VWA domain-containing protein [Planctomycetota bacterium]|jgi:uncharacterized membrane protein